LSVDVVGKGEFPPWLKRQLFQRCNGWGWVGFELCGLVLEQRTQLPTTSLPRKNQHFEDQRLVVWVFLPFSL